MGGAPSPPRGQRGRRCEQRGNLPSPSPPGAQRQRAGRAGVGGAERGAAVRRWARCPHPNPPRSPFASLTGGEGESRLSRRRGSPVTLATAAAAAAHPATPFTPAACPRLVVKIGSSLLVAGGEVRRGWLASVAADIADRRREGQAVVVVTSGAIALGARRLGLAKGGRASLDDAQAAAATGQIVLAAAYAELLEAHGLQAAQMLLTLGDLEDRRRYLNVAATLDRLLSLGAVPVVNENDSVATSEIRFGDNDRLAARVASAGAATGVILLSDVAGLYTADPRADPAARLIPQVTTIDAGIEAMAGGALGSAKGGVGTGGMAAKVAAARIATAAGIPLAIADGRGNHPLAAFADTGRGTVFAAAAAAPARKAWLVARATVAGRVSIDAGAARA
ncbi:MAG: glutamate 5-kinase, partial [Sphingomonadaceae bacterium]|nr:glutamate 5-kinase [Sphingomonadaceae bacterium]